MEARAYLKYARIAPRKVQIVLDLIRNKPVDEAMAILKHTPKAACEPLEKLLKSAMANAENNHNMDKNNLYVAECFVCSWPHSQENSTPCSGPRVQRSEENIAHHNGSQREETKLKEEVNYGPESKSARSSCRRDQGLGLPLVC